MKNKLHERVKDLREKVGLSQVKFAEKLNLSPSFIGDIELGRCSVSTETLIVFAQFFNVSTDYLLGLKDTRN